MNQIESKSKKQTTKQRGAKQKTKQTETKQSKAMTSKSPANAFRRRKARGNAKRNEERNSNSKKTATTSAHKRERQQTLAHHRERQPLSGCPQTNKKTNKTKDTRRPANENANPPSTNKRQHTSGNVTPKRLPYFASCGSLLRTSLFAMIVVVMCQRKRHGRR